MENLKFIISSIIIILLIGLLGFWAFTSMQSGSEHIVAEKQKELEKKNEELEKELSEMKKLAAIAQSEKQAEEESKATSEQPKEDTKQTETAPKEEVKTYKYQELISALQKMVDGNIYLKKGSKGTYVGNVQKFLNLYNGTSNKIDNDYGDQMVTLVKNYQKAVGLTADGEAGPNTFKKMIAWLKTK